MSAFNLDDLLAEIMDDSKPLPTAARVEANQMVNQVGGPAKLAFKDPEAFLEIASAQAAGAFASPAVHLDHVTEDEVTQSVTEVPESVFADSAAREEPAVLPLKVPVFTSPTLMEEMDIRNFATLVTLNTSRWHAKVKDRQASKDAATASLADAAAFETRKHLLVGADELLTAIHTAMDAARAKHYEMTLPWSTTGISDTGKRSGGRLLPNTLFFEYTQAMAEHKANMQAALNAFIPEYPKLIEQAKQKLGRSFKIDEYPNPSSIHTRFDLSFDFSPIPAGDDFKGLPQQQLDALARHLNNNAEKMLQNAMEDIWLRLREAVERMAERLSSPDKKFHDTLVFNVRDTARLLTHLNVTNDVRVEALRKKVDKLLCGHEPGELRKNSVLRLKIGAHAASILQEMDK